MTSSDKLFHTLAPIWPTVRPKYWATFLVVMLLDVTQKKSGSVVCVYCFDLSATSAAASAGHSVVRVHFSSSPICGELSWTEELIRRRPRRATAALNINETRPSPAGQLGQPRTDTASHHSHRRERRRKLLASARGR